MKFGRKVRLAVAVGASAAAFGAGSLLGAPAGSPPDVPDRDIEVDTVEPVPERGTSSDEFDRLEREQLAEFFEGLDRAERERLAEEPAQVEPGGFTVCVDGCRVIPADEMQEYWAEQRRESERDRQEREQERQLAEQEEWLAEQQRDMDRQQDQFDEQQADACYGDYWACHG